MSSAQNQDQKNQNQQEGSANRDKGDMDKGGNKAPDMPADNVREMPELIARMQQPHRMEPFQEQTEDLGYQKPITDSKPFHSYLLLIFRSRKILIHQQLLITHMLIVVVE